MTPGAASRTHLPQPLQATRHRRSAASPSSRLLHWTRSRCSIGMMVNRSLGPASTQSPQAVHLAGTTTGNPTSFMSIASKVQATSQSARPRQPHTQPLPPPAPAAHRAHRGDDHPLDALFRESPAPGLATRAAIGARQKPGHHIDARILPDPELAVRDSDEGGEEKTATPENPG